jgi:hypothetical protein
MEGERARLAGLLALHAGDEPAAWASRRGSRPKTRERGREEEEFLFFFLNTFSKPNSNQV